jgi:hypothetical protein
MHNANPMAEKTEKPPVKSKLAPWLNEDDEPSSKADWLKEASSYIDPMRVPNAGEVGRALVALFQAVSAGK